MNMTGSKPPKKKVKFIDLAEQYEHQSHNFFLKIVMRLVVGFFHFKKQKGEILAGSTTFFSILSFGPVLLLLISLVGLGGMSDMEAEKYVLGTVKANFPGLAPWILKSIEKIITSQLQNNVTGNIVNILFLFYSSLGIIGSVMFGMDTIAQQKARGGFILEDFKSLLVGVTGSLFILALLFYGQYGPMLAAKFKGSGVIDVAMRALLDGNTIPIIMSLAFFTFFYQFASTNFVKLKDSFFGAVTFVGCFLIGKSFYWLYLQVSRDSLTQSYGAFYTLFVAAFWVYYLNCSLFYGASVAYSSEENAKHEAKKKAPPSAPSGPPPISRAS